MPTTAPTVGGLGGSALGRTSTSRSQRGWRREQTGSVPSTPGSMRSSCCRPPAFPPTPSHLPRVISPNLLGLQQTRLDVEQRSTQVEGEGRNIVTNVSTELVHTFHMTPALPFLNPHFIQVHGSSVRVQLWSIWKLDQVPNLLCWTTVFLLSHWIFLHLSLPWPMLLLTYGWKTNGI